MSSGSLYTPISALPSNVTNSSFFPEIVSVANQNGLDPGTFASLLNQESGLNPSAVNSSSGASGIGQFLPSTAADPGYGLTSFDPFNPDASIAAAGQYLAARGGTSIGGINAYQGSSSSTAPSWLSSIPTLSGIGGTNGLDTSSIGGFFGSLLGGSASGPAGGQYLSAISGLPGWTGQAIAIVIGIALLIIGLLMLKGGPVINDVRQWGQT